MEEDGAALLPHEIISCLEDGGDDRAELHWKRMVDDMAKKGKLNNCLAICDVSDTMFGEPMNVCMALGLLVSELSKEPWKGIVITFSKNPKLHMVEGDDLKSKTGFIKRMDWGWGGGKINFRKVFDLILDVATKADLHNEDMVKRVFVFTDMEFDHALKKPWEDDYEVIKREFNENGYGGSIPEIVFWNLRDYSRASTPVVRKKTDGVVLVNGFSNKLMKLFMEDGGSMNPERVMESAISGEEYQKLVVVD
ncbi:uncharacterized protein [Rutidosis leptorrhynchoides]